MSEQKIPLGLHPREAEAMRNQLTDDEDSEKLESQTTQLVNVARLSIYGIDKALFSGYVQLPEHRADI